MATNQQQIHDGGGVGLRLPAPPKTTSQVGPQTSVQNDPFHALPVAAPRVTAAPAVTAGLKQLEQARKAAQKAQEQLRSQYERDKAELQAQFQFAETEQERQTLARALGELNRQRDQGLQTIAAGFGHARTQIEQHGARVAERTPEMAREMGDIYRTAAGDILGQQDVAADWGGVPGLAVNSAGTGIGAVGDLSAAALAAAPREEALAQRLGDITGEDIAWLANMMSGESAAHQADLTRFAQAQAGAYQVGHDERVGSRIAQDRALHAQLAAALQGDYRNRGFQLTDTDIALLQQLGQMQHSAAEQAAQRAQQASLANAQMGHQSGLQAQSLNHQTSLQAASRAAADRQAQAQRGLELAQQQLQMRGPQPGTLAGDIFALDTFGQFGPPSGPTLQRHGFGETVNPLMRQAAGQQLGNLASTFMSLFRR